MTDDDTDGPTGQDRSEPRQHHLAWNGTEWTDDRCGCRYHPDDDNGSHGGAPHVHRCERHAGAGQDVAALRAERDEWARRLDAQACEMAALREQLATARERIAALEALADRWEEPVDGLDNNDDLAAGYSAASRRCAGELRAALTGKAAS